MGYYLIIIIELQMGIPLSKEESYIDLQKGVHHDFLQLHFWSLIEVRKSYECYRRRFNKVTLDGLMLSKILPFTRKISMSIFIKYSERAGTNKPSFPHINIFQFICGLVLLSHADSLCKFQFLLILFDLSHSQNRTFANTIIIFEAMISAYCKITKQEHPSYQNMRNYAENCLLKASLREDSDVSLKRQRGSLFRIQALLDANDDIHQLFMRFEPTTTFQQPHVLFKKFPVYLESEVKEIKLSMKQLYLDQYIDSSKKRSLSHGLMSPEYKYSKRVEFSTLKVEQISNSTSRDKLPSIFKNKKISYNNIPRLIFVGGTSISKDDIFNLLHYFYKLSGGEQIILYQDFLESFGELSFMKKMISTTFRFLDRKQKGKITFENLLWRLFPSIASEDLKLIKGWVHEYKTIYEIGYNSQSLNKEKQQTIILPSQSLVRLKQIFKVLDHGSKGYLTLDDLKKSFKIGYNAKDLEVTFLSLDPQGTNRLNIRQLARLLLPGNYEIDGLPAAP